MQKNLKSKKFKKKKIKKKNFFWGSLQVFILLQYSLLINPFFSYCYIDLYINIFLFSFFELYSNCYNHTFRF